MRGIQGGGISFCILAGMRENAERSGVALATCIFVSIHLVHAHNNTFSSNEHYCKVESCLSPHRSIFRHIRAFKLVGVGKRTGYVLLMISACSRQSRKTTDHRWRDELCQDFWHAGGLNPVRFPPPPAQTPDLLHASMLFQYSLVLSVSESDTEDLGIKAWKHCPLLRPAATSGVTFLSRAASLGIRHRCGHFELHQGCQGISVWDAVRKHTMQPTLD